MLCLLVDPIAALLPLRMSKPNFCCCYVKWLLNRLSSFSTRTGVGKIKSPFFNSGKFVVDSVLGYGSCIEC